MTEDQVKFFTELNDMVALATPGCLYGYKVETDGVIVRVIAWSNDTACYSWTGYGKTVEEAMKNCADFEDTGDIDEIERLNAEWDERNKMPEYVGPAPYGL